MASSAGQTVFAAIAFAGAGTLFHMLDKNGYEAEVKRHNRALEKMARAKEAFLEREEKLRDKQDKLRMDLMKSNYDVKQVNDALETLKEQTYKEDPVMYGGQDMNSLMDLYREKRTPPEEEGINEGASTSTDKEDSTKFHIPSKYMVLGTVFLIACIIVVILIVYLLLR